MESGKSQSTNLPNPIAGEVIDDEVHIERVAQLFRTLGDPSRIKILTLLLETDKNVSSLAELIGISEPAVSHHLRGLRQMRIVRGRRQGREVYYSLDDEHVADLLRQGLDHVWHD
jgi:ArsR family transcriptional regulator